jgi:hypothetical protein
MTLPTVEALRLVLLRVSIEPGWPLFSAKTSFRVSPAVGSVDIPGPLGVLDWG